MRDFLSDCWFDDSRHLFFFLFSKKVLLACAFSFFCVYAFVRVTLFCGSCVLMDRSLCFQFQCSFGPSLSSFLFLLPAALSVSWYVGF